MSRPPAAPSWATNANHAAGGEDWSGQPNKVEPSSGEKAAGFIPTEKVPAEYINWLLGNHADWISFLKSRDVSALREAWIGKAVASSTADPVVNFAHWKLTISGSGGAGLVSNSTSYNGPYVAMSGGAALLETTVPICRRLAGADIRFDFDVAIGSTDLSNAVMKFGLYDSNDYVEFFYDQFSGANFFAKSKDGTTETSTDTTVAPVAAAYPNHRFSIVLQGSSAGDTIKYYIDDVLVATHTGSQGPRATATLRAFFSCDNDGGGTPELKVGAGLVDWNRR